MTISSSSHPKTELYLAGGELWKRPETLAAARSANVYKGLTGANLGGKLYVTFTQQDAAKHDEVAGAGHGIADLFDLNGNFIQRLVTGGLLNSPCGTGPGSRRFRRPDR
jgi:hypothetical protein